MSALRWVWGLAVMVVMLIVLDNAAAAGGWYRFIAGVSLGAGAALWLWRTET